MYVTRPTNLMLLDLITVIIFGSILLLIKCYNLYKVLACSTTFLPTISILYYFLPIVYIHALYIFQNIIFPVCFRYLAAVQIIRLFITQFSYYVPLSALFLDMLCSSLIGRHKISHPYTTASKMLLYIVVLESSKNLGLVFQWVVIWQQCCLVCCL